MISLELRTQIYNILKSDVLQKIRFEGTDLMNVISSIWNVYQRPATEDSRYRNLGDEIDKHYFLNDDWNEDKVFIGKLKILDDEHNYLRFLEETLNVYEKYNTDGYQYVKSEIEPLLEKENIHIQEDKDNNNFIQTIRLIVGDINANHFEDRSRKFYVCSSKITNNVNFQETDIKFPDDNDCFVLTFNYGWNDFDYKTRYHLYYYKDGKSSFIGEVKIMKKDAIDTSEVLPSQFYSLDESFCSLGNGNEYYRNIAKVFPQAAYLYLGELRDAALYTSVQKRFERDYIFKKSLLRDNVAELALRMGRYLIYGRENDETAYSFEYRYTPKYNDDGTETELKFNFSHIRLPYKRIYTLIGENGVGKTTLMKNLIYDIVQDNRKSEERHFIGLPPLFSSVIAITYSPFDIYPLNDDKELSNRIIDYEYCGLLKHEFVLKNIKDRVETLSSNIELALSRTTDFIDRLWQKMMEKVFSEGRLDSIFSNPPMRTKVDKDKLMNLYQNCSSGETIYLESVTAILAKIRLNSILLIDEPEQHLHPTGINMLMTTISEILEQMKSFAIISTHSPYILREVPSSNVMVFHRYENNLAVSPIGIETFGEDVSVISDMVFDNRSQDKIFESYIERVVKDEGFDYNKSIDALRNNDIEPSLNTKMLIMTMIESKKE